MNPEEYDASQAWKIALQSSEYYEHHCQSLTDLREIKRISRVWRRILQYTDIKPAAKLFELGCGGGIHLGKLAVNGFEVHGIDISSSVVEKATNYLSEINHFQPIKARAEVGDIFDYNSSEQYDMCFHFGVVEHFLEASQRHSIWEKLYSLTKTGGWIVSVVPCGQHLMRKTVRENGLMGYQVPEIDYSCVSHREEFEQIGLEPIYTLPHNYFPFLSVHSSRIISKLFYPILYFTGNVLLPETPVPNSFKEKLAASLIVIGKVSKP